MVCFSIVMLVFGGVFFFGEVVNELVVGGAKSFFFFFFKIWYTFGTTSLYFLMTWSFVSAPAEGFLGKS